jgi:hypothetical protein
MVLGKPYGNFQTVFLKLSEKNERKKIQTVFFKLSINLVTVFSRRFS